MQRRSTLVATKTANRGNTEDVRQVVIGKSKEDQAVPNNHCLGSTFNLSQKLGELTLTDMWQILHAKLHDETEFQTSIRRFNRKFLC